MSSLTKEKAEPGLVFVGIYAFMMAGFGGLFGFIYLMSFPLKGFSNLQERAEALEARESPGPITADAFFIKGPTLRTSSWETKRQQLIDASATTIKVTAGEINAWLGTKFRPSAVPTDQNEKDLLIEPDRPNIGITSEGEIYLNLPAKISGYGLDGSYALSAQVRYSRASPPDLLVDHLQIGGAGVPLPGILGAQLVSAILQAFSSAEEYAVISQAWNRVQSVEVSDRALILTLDRP